MNFIRDIFITLTCVTYLYANQLPFQTFLSDLHSSFQAIIQTIQ